MTTFLNKVESLSTDPTYSVLATFSECSDSDLDQPCQSSYLYNGKKFLFKKMRNPVNPCLFFLRKGKKTESCLRLVYDNDDDDKCFKL